MRLIEQLRKKKGWNQTALAFHGKCTQSRISMMESGVYNPPADGVELKRLAKALGVPAKDAGKLLDEAKEPAKK